MIGTGQGILREVRAGVFTLVCLTLSVALHGWAAGAVPPLPAIFAGAGLVLLAAFALAGRERGFPFIVLTLLSAQAALHYLFEAVPHPDHGMTMASGVAPSTVTMICAHLAAGVFTAAWLRGGEVAAWRLCQWLVRSVLPLHVLWTLVRLLVVAPLRAGRAWAHARPLVAPAPVWWHSVIRRGPPAAALTLG